MLLVLEANSQTTMTFGAPAYIKCEFSEGEEEAVFCDNISTNIQVVLEMVSYSTPIATWWIGGAEISFEIEDIVDVEEEGVELISLRAFATQAEWLLYHNYAKSELRFLAPAKEDGSFFIYYIAYTSQRTE